MRPNAESTWPHIARLRLPPCTAANGCFHKLNQAGALGRIPSDPGWSVEISLDLDRCPRLPAVLDHAGGRHRADPASCHRRGHRGRAERHGRLQQLRADGVHRMEALALTTCIRTSIVASSGDYGLDRRRSGVLATSSRSRTTLTKASTPRAAGRSRRGPCEQRLLAYIAKPCGRRTSTARCYRGRRLRRGRPDTGLASTTRSARRQATAGWWSADEPVQPAHRGDDRPVRHEIDNAATSTLTPPPCTTRSVIERILRQRHLCTGSWL